MMHCGAGLAQAASMGCGPTTATRALVTSHTTAATRPLTSTPLRLRHSGRCTMTGQAALGVRSSCYRLYKHCLEHSHTGAAFALALSTCRDDDRDDVLYKEHRIAFSNI